MNCINWKHPALVEGLRCYRAQEFFEAHEHWEGVWLSAAEPDKTFLQALIQVSAAFHHLHRKNTRGAVSLLRRALRKLESYPREYGGVAVEDLRESMRAWLSALEQGSTGAQLCYPIIR